MLESSEEEDEPFAFAYVEHGVAVGGTAEVVYSGAARQSGVWIYRCQGKLLDGNSVQFDIMVMPNGYWRADNLRRTVTYT